MKSKIFKANGTDVWVRDVAKAGAETSAEWYLEKAEPVYRSPQARHKSRSTAKGEKIWYLAETSGGADPVDSTDWLWCVWNSQAGRWIVLTTLPSDSIKIGVADAEITPGSSGTISIWRKNATTGVLEDTGDNETALLDWLHGDKNVSIGKQVAIAYFANSGFWRILWAECETSATQVGETLPPI